MFSRLRGSSLPFAATLVASLLAGCGASKAHDTSASASHPANLPSGEGAAYAQGPAEEGVVRDGEDHSAESSEIGKSSPSTSPPVSEERDALHDRGPSASKRASSRDYQQREERPGLGTTWGESRDSQVHGVSFIRHSSNEPLALLRVQYNDEEGLVAQFGESIVDRLTANYAEPPGRFVSVEIVDLNGSALPGITTGDRTHVVGRNGDGYAIRVRNHERRRLEIVATVDGLDVIDGLKGNYGKRGYVVNAYGTLLIEGYRRSSQEVAAFRFGSVRSSYSAQSGKGDRNVGVIGIAAFDERRAEPVYTERELELRDSADPFPARYARPPVSNRAR